ncbi:MAG: AMP-binding protein [Flavobacteriaceae bacterium]|nr:AMP-binding protein [Flavobacteriaceae bacterium]
MSNYNSPLEAFLYWEANTPDCILFEQPINGEIIEFSYVRVGQEARKIAAHLQSYDLPKGSHIAILSKNCAHWLIADLAIMMAGYVSVPIYASLNPHTIHQVLVHSDSKVVIVGKLDDFEYQISGVRNIDVISIDVYGDSHGVLWGDIVASAMPLKEIHQWQPEDVMTIVYTSGTTGEPKGVMHTFGNLMTSIDITINAIKLPNNLHLFSYLPLANLAERLIASAAVVVGAKIFFITSKETFVNDIVHCQPKVLLSVPMVWMKLQDHILENMSQIKLNILLNIPFLKEVFRRKIKAKLGLNSTFFIFTATAPMPISLTNWYRKLGIDIFQGYGTTEDCCISHFNLPDNHKIGTVGKPLDNVQVKLSPEGEILVKNTCLMKGYYKDPEMTASAFTEDGYFKTGDIGEYDSEGYLTIIGRIKDQFKTDKGKYIFPESLELELLKNIDIKRVCVVGSGAPAPIALIILSEQGKMKARDMLILSIEESLNKMKPLFETYEHIAKVVIMKEDWNIENGLTTPTLKLKRNSIERINRPYYKNWSNTPYDIIFE